jgi:hypothetical protein
MHDGLAYLKKNFVFLFIGLNESTPRFSNARASLLWKKIKPEKTRHNPTLFPFSAGGPVPNAVIPGFVPPHEQESIR